MYLSLRNKHKESVENIKIWVHSAPSTVKVVSRVAQSVYRLTTGWTVRGSNPGKGEIFRTRPDRPWVQWVPGLSWG
jgi:hypothetical protein